MSAAPVIAVDGPSGSGKGTLARWLARTLNWRLLDSGALYRLVAIQADRLGLSAADAQARGRMAKLAREMNVEFIADDQDNEHILLDGEEITAAVREERTGGLASDWAQHQPIRDALLAFQRNQRQAPGLVADGRDMGTVVFPDAPLKLFVTASAEERARRRQQQLSEIGVESKLRALCAEIQARDERDMNRAVAPLRPADDALTLDTTTMAIDEVRQHSLDLAKRRFSLK